MHTKFVPLVCFVVLLGGCGAEGPNSSPTGGSYVSSVLVDADWVEMNRERPNVIIIDIADSEEAWLTGHLPGARFLNWRTDIVDPGRTETFTVLSRDSFEALMSRLGVSNDSILLLYDDASSRLAARMFWTLRYYGHEELRILDGGRGAWERAGFTFSDQTSEIRETNYRVQQVNEHYLADLEFINQQIRSPGFTLVDARSSEQYTGEQSGRLFGSGIEHRNKGHIYGAQNVVWSDNLNEDGTFKSYDELLTLYQPHGVTTDKTVVTYCNVGILGSSPWFVLSELLGYEDVRLYDSSMAEWANNDDSIMVMGKHCM